MNDAEFRQAEKDWHSFVEKLTERLTEIDDTVPELPVKDVVRSSQRRMHLGRSDSPCDRSSESIATFALGTYQYKSTFLVRPSLTGLPCGESSPDPTPYKVRRTDGSAHRPFACTPHPVYMHMLTHNHAAILLRSVGACTNTNAPIRCLPEALICD